MRSLTLVSLLVVAACRPGRPPTEAAPVGWTLDGPDEPLKEGRLRAVPPGGEERLVPGLAEATRTWSRACAPSITDQTVAFRVVLAADGAVRSVTPEAPGLLSRCLADQATGKRIPGAAAPGETRFQLALRFSPPKVTATR
jgi:hypothetical protein